MKKALAAMALFLISCALIFGPNAMGGVPRWDLVPSAWVGGVIPYALDTEIPDQKHVGAPVSSPTRAGAISH